MDMDISGTSIDFDTNGDQVVVFQASGTGAYPSDEPDFIFILNGDAGNFNSNATSNHSPYYLTPAPMSPQANDGSGTSIPTGLDDDNSTPGTATAMAVGDGGGEIDNVIFNGTGLIPFMGANLAEKVMNAKIAILAPNPSPTSGTGFTRGLNWHGENNTITNSDPYDTYQTLLLSSGNLLPVELTSFQGRPKVNTIDLQWVTASETNNDYFAVEKSTNGIDFKEMTEIDGRGTTTLESYYNWVDQLPNNGLNYYRLLQVDFNGDKSYSNIIVIEFEIDRSSIQVYPNPTNKELNINLPENWEGETSIVVYDFYGKLISSFTSTSGSLTFPVDNIPAGMYRLSATNKNRILNTSFVKK
jgi:hypothetical protein